MKVGVWGLALVAATLLGTGSVRGQGEAGAYAAGRAAYARQDFAAARKAFERAVALAPRDAEYHYWLGRALGMQALHASIFSRFSLARRAKAEFERAVALDPRSWQAREALVVYYVRAPAIAGGSKSEALAQARAIKHLNPYRGGLAVERVLRATGRREEAATELRSLAAAYPDSVRPREELRQLAAAKR